MTYLWCVITHARNEEGNQAVIDAELLEPLAACLPGGMMQTLELRKQVFHPGELFLIDGEYGREVGYPQRKPSKWDIGYRTFPIDRLDDALAVVKESTQ